MFAGRKQETGNRKSHVRDICRNDNRRVVTVADNHVSLMLKQWLGIEYGYWTTRGYQLCGHKVTYRIISIMYV